MLMELFGCIGIFIIRLRVYIEIPFNHAMADFIVKTLAEMLSVLAIATKRIKQGRFSDGLLLICRSSLGTSQRNLQRNS
jgi:hypothetical protein